MERTYTEAKELAINTIQELVIADFKNGSEEAVYSIYKNPRVSVDYYLPQIKHLFTDSEYSDISRVIACYGPYLPLVDFLRGADVVALIDFSKIDTTKICLEKVDLTKNKTITLEQLVRRDGKRTYMRGIISPEFDVSGLEFHDWQVDHSDISRWKNFDPAKFFPEFKLSKTNPLAIRKSYRCVDFPAVDASQFHFNHIQLRHCYGFVNTPKYKFEQMPDGRLALRFISIGNTKRAVENSISTDEACFLNALKPESVYSQHTIDSNPHVFLGKYYDRYMFYNLTTKGILKMSLEQLKRYPEVENYIVDKYKMLYITI